MAAFAAVRLHLQVCRQLRSLCIAGSSHYVETGNAAYPHEQLQARSYATQRHRKLIAEAQKRNRQRKLEKPKEKVKSYLKVKNKGKLLLQPRRVNDDHLPKLPACDDVYYMKNFAKPSIPTAEAVEMHKETHHPTMWNDMDAFLYAFVELDLSLKKKNRYRENFSGTVLYPHTFEVGKRKKRIMALTKNTDAARDALEAGADVAGGLGLIKQILSGEVDYKSFNYVLASVDIVDALPQLRGLLKYKYPQATTGTIGADLPGLVKNFLTGIDFASGSDSNELDYGFVEVPVGRLSMQTDQLVENVKALVTTVETFKPKGTSPGTFITKVELKCMLTSESFKIAYDEYLPDYAVKKEEAELDTEEAEAAEQAA